MKSEIVKFYLLCFASVNKKKMTGRSCLCRNIVLTSHLLICLTSNYVFNIIIITVIFTNSYFLFTDNIMCISLSVTGGEIILILASTYPRLLTNLSSLPSLTCLTTIIPASDQHYTVALITGSHVTCNTVLHGVIIVMCYMHSSYL